MRSLLILSLLNLLAINSKWVFGQQQVQYLNPNFVNGGEFMQDLSNIQPYYCGNVFVPYPYLSQIEIPPIVIDQNVEDEVFSEEDIVIIKYVPQAMYDALRAAIGTLNMTKDESVSPNININHSPVIEIVETTTTPTIEITVKNSEDAETNSTLDGKDTEVVETTTDNVKLLGSGTTTDADDHSQNSEEQAITTTISTIETTEMNSGDGNETVSFDTNISYPPVTEVVEATTDNENRFGSGTTTDHSHPEEQAITTTTSTFEITEMNSGDGKEDVSSDTNMSTTVPVVDGSELTEITTTAQHNSNPTETHSEDDDNDSSDEQVKIPNIVITEKNSNYEVMELTSDENDINDLDKFVSSDTEINNPVTVVDDSGVAIISKNDTNDNAEAYNEAKEHVFKPNMVIQKETTKYDIIKPTTDENDIESYLNETVFSQVSSRGDIAEVQTGDTTSGIITDDAAREISPTEASGFNDPSVNTEEKNTGDARIRLDSDQDGTTVAAIPISKSAFISWF